MRVWALVLFIYLFICLFIYLQEPVYLFSYFDVFKYVFAFRTNYFSDWVQISFKSKKEDILNVERHEVVKHLKFNNYLPSMRGYFDN